jgi:hypothetical protein
MKRYTFRHRIYTGEIAESDLIITTPREWNGSVEEMGGSWCVIRDEDAGQVLALKLVLGMPPVEPAWPGMA